MKPKRSLSVVVLCIFLMVGLSWEVDAQKITCKLPSGALNQLWFFQTALIGILDGTSVENLKRCGLAVTHHVKLGDE